MWPKAAWKTVYEPQIRAAAGLGVAPDQPDPDHYAARYAHCECWWWAAARPASRRHWPRPKAACASSCATSRPSSAARCASRAARGSTARTAGLGASGRGEARRHGQCPRAAAHHRFRLLRAEFRRRWPSASAIICRSRPTLPRERLWQVRAKQRRAGHRRHRAPHGVRRQRPAGHHAGRARRAPTSTTTASRSARNVGVYTANDSAYARGDRSRSGPASTIAAIVDLRDACRRRRCRRGRTPGRHRDPAGRRGGRRTAASCASSVDDGGAEAGGAERARSPSIALLMSAGWTPSRASVLAIARQGRLRRRRPGASCPAGHAQDCARSAPATAPTGSRPPSPRRWPPASRGARSKPARTSASARAARPSRRRLGRRHAGRCPRRRCRHDGQGLRRFPERRHRQGHQARGARGLALDRARQALHHQRHGDRPGQDLEHATAWRSPPRRSARPFPRSG